MHILSMRMLRFSAVAFCLKLSLHQTSVMAFMRIARNNVCTQQHRMMGKVNRISHFFYMRRGYGLQRVLSMSTKSGRGRRNSGGGTGGGYSKNAGAASRAGAAERNIKHIQGPNSRFNPNKVDFTGMKGLSTSSTRKSTDFRKHSIDDGDDVSTLEGVRTNKCLPGLSRRGADKAVAEGRVTINGKVAQVGDRVQSGDDVRLDGKRQLWQGKEDAKKVKPAKTFEERNFAYVKYWKPRGVTCTSNIRDACNIITAGRFDLFPQRMFTVGRLDKDSTGLILLTSDGRVNNAMLRPALKKEKVYEVEMNHIPSDVQIKQLASGVVITTVAQKDTRRDQTITRVTQPCYVKRIPAPRGRGGSGVRATDRPGRGEVISGGSRWLEFTLTEGRNRQIRKMAEAVGLEVINLHRTGFAGIRLTGVAEGNWQELSESDMEIIQRAVEAADEQDRATIGSTNSNANNSMKCSSDRQNEDNHRAVAPVVANQVISNTEDKEIEEEDFD